MLGDSVVTSSLSWYNDGRTSVVLTPADRMSKTGNYATSLVTLLQQESGEPFVVVHVAAGHVLWHNHAFRAVLWTPHSDGQCPELDAFIAAYERIHAVFEQSRQKSRFSQEISRVHAEVETWQGEVSAVPLLWETERAVALVFKGQIKKEAKIEAMEQQE